MGLNCLKATEPLRGDSLLFISKSPGVAGTHLNYLKKDERPVHPLTFL